jgi:hypothetical protein
MKVLRQRIFYEESLASNQTGPQKEDIGLDNHCRRIQSEAKKWEPKECLGEHL